MKIQNLFEIWKFYQRYKIYVSWAANLASYSTKILNNTAVEKVTTNIFSEVAMGVPKTEVQKSDKTGKTTTPASKMRRGKKKVGQPLDPALQKILHRETVTNNEAVASSPSKMSNKSSLTEEAIDEILNRLATCENSIDKSDLFILFKLESWKILSRNLDRNSEVLANVIKSLSSGLILNIVPKLMVDLLTKFQSTEENSDSAKLLQNCLKVLCENSESRKAFFQSFESHLFKFVDSPVEMHASLIENLSVVGNESQGNV